MNGFPLRWEIRKRTTQETSSMRAMARAIWWVARTLLAFMHLGYYWQSLIDKDLVYNGSILTYDIHLAHPSLEPRQGQRNTWSRQCALRHEGTTIFSIRKRLSAHKANHRFKYFDVDSKRLFERNPLCLARSRQAPKWRIVSTANQKGDYIRWESGYVYVRQGSSDIKFLLWR